MVLLFIGPSASGKDTQASLLDHKFGFETISTGELVRQVSNGRNDMQKMIRDEMREGFLDNDLVFGLLKLYLHKSLKENLILTGVVRKFSQIKLLDSLLKVSKRKLEKVIYFELKDEEAVRRMSGRLYCRVCKSNYHLEFNPPEFEGICDFCGAHLFRRDDDNPAAVLRRLAAFKKDNKKIIEEFRERRILHTIDASKSIREIHKEIVEFLHLER